LKTFLEFIGVIASFAARVITSAWRSPYEFEQTWMQVGEIGARSLPLVAASGLALGVVMTLHTHSTLVTFGAAAMIPKVQSLSFFIEIGPLVAALLVAGRVGAGIGAVLANLRASEQIDAIEVLSVDSFKFLVVPRVVACVLVLPLLTTFMDLTALLGGFLAEHALSHLSAQLFIERAFNGTAWSNFVPPTLKTTVFGFLIGTVSCYYGYTTDEGAEGVGRAATNSVVLSSLLVIVADVALVKIIFLFFPGSAL
jgi:phospholipid/cholesterol/gamma-HCH transport system permease protein